MPAVHPGIRGQTNLDDILNFGGTIASGGTAQLLLPQQPRRTSFQIINTSASDTLYVGIGPARATASLTSGTVSSIAVTNAGIGYTVAPQVRLLGGLVAGDFFNAPANLATAHAVLAGSAIGSIVVDYAGSGYNVAPIVYLENPWPGLGGGAFLPSSGHGVPLAPGVAWSSSGMLISPASAVAIWGNTTGDSFECLVGGLV